MTKSKRICAAFLLVVLLMLTLPVSTEAASRGVYYRPALTFITENAPADLLLRIDFDRDGEIISHYLYREDRLWESYFRFYRQTSPVSRVWYGNRVDFENAVLVAETDGKETRIPITEETLKKLTMNDIFMLDTKDFSMRYGLPLWRTILLFCLRVVLALAVALLVLYFFQYRWKKSWITAIITHLICQSGISLFVSNWVNYNPKMIAVHFLVLLGVLILQIPVFWHFLDEDQPSRSVSYAFWANVATGVLNIFIIIVFPL